MNRIRFLAKQYNSINLVCSNYKRLLLYKNINNINNRLHSTTVNTMMTNNNDDTIKKITKTTSGTTTAAAATTTITKSKVDLKAPITLTERAAERIKEMIQNKEDTVGVKISVKRRGCNGYSYMMNYANTKDVEAKKDDIVIAYGVTVLVDPKAIFFIVGTVMDYEETDLSAEFTFTNPNSKGECGCGESFNV